MTTLWLTRLIPNPSSREARRDFTNAVNLHYRVMKLFPDDIGDQARQQLGVLFRAEETPVGPYLLIQSLIQPDPHKLPDHYGACDSRPLSQLLEYLRPDLPVRYRIVANAVRKPRKTTQEIYGLKDRVALSGAAAQDWWTRQATNSGLKLASVEMTRLDNAHGTRAQGQQRIRHARTKFEGVAHIEDPDLVRQRITSGIGPGKAYGCGLLSLAPASSGG